MAKKYPVRSLRDISMGKLVIHILSTLRYAMRMHPQCHVRVIVKDIRTYLEYAGATNNIHDYLLQIILGLGLHVEDSVRFLCLKLLLNFRVSILEINKFPSSYNKMILQLIDAQGTGLRTLNLEGLLLKDEPKNKYMQYMMSIVQNCPNLTKLYIPWIANDELLKVIAKNCTKLQLINISGKTDITKIGIEFLSKGVSCTQLTVVDVGRYDKKNISYSDIAKIVEHCPNVETLCSNIDVGSALKYIYDNVDVNFKCKLKYLHDIRTNEETLKAIVKTCPKLESLKLTIPKGGILHILNDIFLQKLEVYDFSCNELLQVLKKPGRNLSYLNMGKGEGNLEIGKLSRSCPALNYLHFCQMDTLSYIRCSYKFERLERFQLHRCSMISSSLIKFICYSNSLKLLTLDTVTFNDEDMISLFVEHEFKELENICLISAPNLTIAALKILLDHCPKLQYVGQLSGWALTPADLDVMRGLLKSGNSCVQLSPTCFVR